MTICYTGLLSWYSPVPHSMVRVFPFASWVVNYRRKKGTKQTTSVVSTPFPCGRGPHPGPLPLHGMSAPSRRCGGALLAAAAPLPLAAAAAVCACSWCYLCSAAVRLSVVVVTFVQLVSGSAVAGVQVLLLAYRVIAPGRELLPGCCLSLLLTIALEV